MNAIVYSDPYKLPAGILAVAVHGVFFVLLYFGFTWQTQPPATMSVELWQSLPETIISPSIQPAELVTPPEEIVKPDVVQRIVKPEIIIPDKKKPVPTEKLTIRSAELKREAKIAEQAAREQAGRESRARTEQAAAIGRVVGEYTDKIRNKIHTNIVMPPDVASDAQAVFLVTLLPGGTVLSARLTKSSGNAAYDSAIERAILKSQPLPLPADVAMFKEFRELKLVFKPVE